MWYHKNVGGERCPIVDTWWQTETGGHMITPLPGVTPLVPGSCTLPLPGHHGGDRRRDRPRRAERPGRHPRHQAAVAVDDPHDLGRPGALSGSATTPRSSAASSTSPATARCATRTTGYFTIMGRIDDVLNVSGHRLGTMEIESALVANPIVAEAAVVGRPDDMTGEAVCAFVVLKRARPTGDEAREDREGAARLGRQGDRPDREAEGHPLRRQPAEDALGQDHAAAAALDRQGRGDHAGRVDAREPGDPRAVEAGAMRKPDDASPGDESFAGGGAANAIAASKRQRGRRLRVGERRPLAELVGEAREIRIASSASRARRGARSR